MDLTPKTAYWLGAVLTDGWFQRVEGRRQVMHRVNLKVIDRDFLEAVNEACLEMVGTEYSIIPRPAPSPKAKPQWLMQMTNSRLYAWGMEQTEGKERVPRAMFQADREVQLGFLAGVMDGDGWFSLLNRKGLKPTWSISSFCQIGVASCDPWLGDLHRLTASMGLPSKGPKLMKRNNPNWRPIYMLNFSVIPFVEAGVPVRIERKRGKLEAMRRHSESSEAIRSARLAG